MGIAVSPVRWGITTLLRTPGQWLITVTNTGTIASSFIPLEVAVSSDLSTVESISLNTEDHSQLRPGESMQYRLELKREGFPRFEGWDRSNFDAAAEDLTLELSFFGPGDPESNRIRLPLLF